MRFIDRRALREKQELARQLRRKSTPEEKILWRELRANKQAGVHFRRQHVLAGFIVDFYCSSAKLIIELDGGHHQYRVEADHQRDAVLRGLGNQILRFPNSAVRNDLKGVLEKISKLVPPSPVRGRGTGG
jgi:very-short-patch-repair endonuclease